MAATNNNKQAEYRVAVLTEAVHYRTIVAKSQKEAEAIAKELANDLCNFDDYNFGAVMNIEVDKVK